MVQRERRFDKLKKQGAEEFTGTTDPTQAERWLKRIERVFNLMKCTPEEKFDYAVFLLQGDAYDWWETIPNSTVQPPVLTWDDFVVEFRNNYMPEVYLDVKRREFLNLKQGKMSVAEYEVKFNQLSTYVSSLVATEKDKCRQFEEGLRFEIRNRITAYDLETYVKLKAAAIRGERLEKERVDFRSKRGYSDFRAEQSKKFTKRKANSSPSQLSNRGAYSANRGGRMSAPSYSRQSQRQSSGVRSTCNECGRYHEGECRKLTGGCFYFGSLDHLIRNCPKQRKAEKEGSAAVVQNTRASGIVAPAGRGRGRGTSTTGGIGRSETQSSKHPTQVRAFALTRQEAIDAPEVVTGKLLIYNLEAYALIDPGSSHSFISSNLASHLHIDCESLGFDLHMGTPLGEFVIVNQVYRNSLIQIGSVELSANLILLNIREFDVILGMDWLTKLLKHLST
ncbi:uncharacterized protein [Euphorbia lathyris]|uniref:uncharacterized protein n=1 Tax=Euphorbia lathyris TaxID=212925 RepID=UPI003313A0EA